MSSEYQIMIALFVVAIIWIYWEAVLYLFIITLTVICTPIVFLIGVLWGMISSIWRLVRRN